MNEPEFADVTYQIIGTESSWAVGYEEQLRTTAKRLGLDSRFQFRGGVSYSEIHLMYQSGDLMVSTSLTGAIDKTVLEAIGCGLPTLVVEPAYQPILREETPNLLVEPQNAKDLAEKLMRLLRTSAASRVELGLKLRARAIEQHNLDQLAMRLVHVFEEVLG
jgi:glycosyltransferase involved in cell wall biosynthesis